MYKCMGHKGTMTLSHEIWAFGSLKTGDTIFKYGHKMKNKDSMKTPLNKGVFIWLCFYIHSYIQ